MIDDIKRMSHGPGRAGFKTNSDDHCLADQVNVYKLRDFDTTRSRL